MITSLSFNPLVGASGKGAVSWLPYRVVKMITNLIVFSLLIIPQVQNRVVRSLDETIADDHISDVRLPRDVAPLEYELFLNISVAENSYYGSVNFFILCQDDTDRITLHAHPRLEIPEGEVRVNKMPDTTTTTTTTTEIPVAPVPVGAARLLPFSSSFIPENACSTPPCAINADNIEQGEQPDNAPVITDNHENDSTTYEVAKVERQHSKQWIIIHLGNRLKRGGKYLLHIEFSGIVAVDVKEGLYTESFVNEEWVKKSYIASQMRPNNARKVFPCFDEPSYKVPFAISIATKSPYQPVSNFPVIKVNQHEEDWKVHEFQVFPPMATFSLAFLICDSSLDFIAGNKVSVWARTDLLKSVAPKAALNYAVKIIDELNDYFVEAIPIPELKIISLPEYTGYPDSCWGFIVIKESYLTCEKCLLQLLTREITEQWIGNLINPHWWDSVPISKALINFIAFIVEQKLDPSVTSSSRLWSTHYPLYYELSKWNPMHISQSTKVELIIRMFNYTLSGTSFRNGMMQLLQERKYKTFTQEDIWSVLTEQAGIDDTLPEPATVSQIAVSWLSKQRLPYVKISRDYEKQLAEVEQHVFIRDLDDPEKDELTWWIPLVVVSQNNLTFTNTKATTWMKEEKRIILHNLPSSMYFIIVNPEEIGPFLVNYDRKNWFLISEYLERNINNLQIPPGTRAKIVHDALNLAIGGKLRFDSALNITKFLIHERDPIVWNAALNIFDHILRQLEGTVTMKKFEEYITIILESAYMEWMKRIDDLCPYEERMLALSKAAMCNAGFEHCIQEARNTWKSWMNAEDPDAGIPVPQSHFCWIFKHGSAEEWEFGRQRYLNFPVAHKQSDRAYLLKTLVSCPVKGDRVEKMLNETLLGPIENSSEYNIRTLLGSLTSNTGYNALLKMLSNNFDELKNRHHNNSSRLWDNIVSSATRHFKTQEGLDKVSQFYVSHQGRFSSAEPIIDQSLQHIKKEVKWMDDNLVIIDQWLDAYLSKNRRQVKG